VDINGIKEEIEKEANALRQKKPPQREAQRGDFKFELPKKAPFAQRLFNRLRLVRRIKHALF
jgi:hypothetical protein